jgi:hypothetical protein
MKWRCFASDHSTGCLSAVPVFHLSPYFSAIPVPAQQPDEKAEERETNILSQGRVVSSRAGEQHNRCKDSKYWQTPSPHSAMPYESLPALRLHLKPGLSPTFIGCTLWRDIRLSSTTLKVFYKARCDEPHDTENDKRKQVYERRWQRESLGEPVHCHDPAIHYAVDYHPGYKRKQTTFISRMSASLRP